MRVLIVDDSRAMRQYVRGILREWSGLQVQEVASGFEAFKVLARESFDLVITDVNMPDINGLDLVRFIRNNKRHAKTRIAVITTQTARQTRDKLLALGVDAFVTKPFEPDAIRPLIDDLESRGEETRPSDDE